MVPLVQRYLLKQDLDAANERKITVAEVTGSNVVSVAEHVIMTILNGVRNFVPGK
jgi:formate dehydrogenase